MLPGTAIGYAANADRHRYSCETEGNWLRWGCERPRRDINADQCLPRDSENDYYFPDPEFPGIYSVTVIYAPLE